MKEPRDYRRFDYPRQLLPNAYLVTLEDDVVSLDQARERTGLTLGYPGWGVLYYALLSHLDPASFNHIIETGTNRGCSTIVLAQALKDSGCRGIVHTIELDPKNFAEATCNLERAGLLAFVRARRGDSREELKALSAGIDVVRVAFLDASHKYADVLEEFEILRPMLGADSIVIFDNTYPIADAGEDPCVHGALHELVRRHGGNLVNFPYVSWHTPGLAIWQRDGFGWSAQEAGVA